MALIALNLIVFLCAVSALLGILPLLWRPRPHITGLPKPAIPVESAGASRFFTAPLSLVGKLLAGAGARVEGLKGQLRYVGSRFSVEEFFGLKALLTLAGGVAAGALAKEVGEISPLALLLGGAVGFIAPDLWLRSLIGRRQKAIMRVLPEVIDLLSLCVGAGLDFLGAINKVLLVKAFKKEPFIQELSVVLQEVKLGKRRAESLKTLAKRVGLSEVSSFVRTLVQADRMGTPISEVLAVHSEDVRIQRFLRAERAALKAPIKILFPLIFCIMPCIGLIIGAPVFLQFMHQGAFGK